jgi:hypothetical protein
VAYRKAPKPATAAAVDGLRRNDRLRHQINRSPKAFRPHSQGRRLAVTDGREVLGASNAKKSATPKLPRVFGNAAGQGAKISLVEVFRARCEARAILYAACDLDLHAAVDVLQADAETSGLIAEIGQDAVQAIMAEVFALGGDRDAVSDPIPEHRPADAAASTLQAAEYLVREGDPKQLRGWLAKHSARERTAIRHHLQRKSRNAP